jgi:hypothetical protein
MIIIGADYHPAFHTETGELQERRLEHPEAAEKFYRELGVQGKRVRVGMEPNTPSKASAPSPKGEKV